MEGSNKSFKNTDMTWQTGLHMKTGGLLNVKHKVKIKKEEMEYWQ